MPRRLVPLALILLAATAAAQPVHVTAVKGAARSGQLVSLDEKGVRVDLGDGAKIDVPLAELVGLEFREAGTTPPLRAGGSTGAPDESAVRIELLGGDRLAGVLASGTEDDLTLRVRRVGDLVVPLDAVRAVRFLAAGDAARRARPEGEKDSLTFRGGDAMTGWLVEMGATALVIDSAVAADYRVPYERIAAIFLRQDEVEEPEGLVLRLSLRDGSRMTGRAPRLEDGHLTFLPVLPGAEESEKRWRVPVGALAHLTVRGGAFRHLSDVADWDVKVVPFFPPAEGEAGPVRVAGPAARPRLLRRPDAARRPSAAKGRRRRLRHDDPRAAAGGLPGLPGRGRRGGHGRRARVRDVRGARRRTVALEEPAARDG
jgi:hypothetical protein